MRKYAATKSYTIVGEAIDDRSSGSSCDRPALNEIVARPLHEPPEFDVLIIAERTRLARHVVTEFFIIRDLFDRGIRVEAVDNDRLFETVFAELFPMIGLPGQSITRRRLGSRRHRHEGK